VFSRKKERGGPDLRIMPNAKTQIEKTCRQYTAEEQLAQRVAFRLCSTIHEHRKKDPGPNEPDVGWSQMSGELSQRVFWMERQHLRSRVGGGTPKKGGEHTPNLSNKRFTRGKTPVEKKKSEKAPLSTRRTDTGKIERKSGGPNGPYLAGKRQ